MTNYSIRDDPDSAEIVRACAGREPGATRIVAALTTDGRRFRAWAVDGPDGLAAALVVRRVCANRWFATPLLLDARAAPVVARLVDASRAVMLEGPVDQVEPIVPHLIRSRREIGRLPFVVMDGLVASVRPADIDPRVRPARRDDLDALTELYRQFELTPIPTVPRLRRFLRDRIDRGLVGVLEERGRVLAAGYGAARTDEFVILTGLTVRPEARSRGLGAALMPLAALQAQEAGVRLAGVWAATNAIRLKPERVARWTGGQALAGWCQVRMDPPPSRFRGERRLHALLERIEGRVDRRPQVPVDDQLPGEPVSN